MFRKALECKLASIDLCDLRFVVKIIKAQHLWCKDYLWTSAILLPILLCRMWENERNLQGNS